MNEDSEFGILVPLGSLVFLQRFPVGAERALVIDPVDLLENGSARSIIFRAGLLPYLVDRGWILGRRRRGRRNWSLGTGREGKSREDCEGYSAGNKFADECQ